MRYINKLTSPQTHAGLAVTRQILDAKWEGDHYKDFQYDKDDMDDMRKILVAEQSDSEDGEVCYCCYCMRKVYLNNMGLHFRNISLEHIIPNRINESDWLQDKRNYDRFANLDSSRVNVCFGGVLAEHTAKIEHTPFPHFISYHNLVVSCNGKMWDKVSIETCHCCNVRRGDRYIEPLYLYDQVENLLGYDKNGKLDFDDEVIDSKYFDEEHTNLRSESMCRMRRFWYLVALEGYSELQIAQAENDKDLRNRILDDIAQGREESIWETFRGDIAWNLLSEYSWFYQYYCKKYPSICYPKNKL